MIMDYGSLALLAACIIALVIGILSVFLIAFFCNMEAEDVPMEPHESEGLTRNMSPVPCSSTSDSTFLMCTAV